MTMPGRKTWTGTVLTLVFAAAVGLGCLDLRSAHTDSRNYSLGDAPVDPPADASCQQFDDRIPGGRLFQLYCASCHNARPLGERPFSNYEVAMAHMREQAYLTGKEYRQLIHFLRRWHDVGPPTPDVEPSPKRFFFSRPIRELRKEAPKSEAQPGGPADAAGP